MTRLLNAALFKPAKYWKQPKGPSEEHQLHQEQCIMVYNAVKKKKKNEYAGDQHHSEYEWQPLELCSAQARQPYGAPSGSFLYTDIE